MNIDYDHARNTHDLPGPRAAFSALVAGAPVRSLLDVGCGTGTWLKAAEESGLTDILGVDGVRVPSERFWVSPQHFSQQDLTRPWKLGRRFDTVLCLEVAEHLDPSCAPILVDALVAHSDRVVFGAACPGQAGQHHVNCQWPAYWQQLFNERGYACSDAVRWKIWTDDRVEAWYRQNIFVATRDPAQAGQEPRIVSVIHPAMHLLMAEADFEKKLEAIENGWLPFKWYLECPPKALSRKIFKKLK